jgi:hypothetical protein
VAVSEKGGLNFLWRSLTYGRKRTVSRPSDATMPMRKAIITGVMITSVLLLTFAGCVPPQDFGQVIAKNPADCGIPALSQGV